MLSAGLRGCRHEYAQRLLWSGHRPEQQAGPGMQMQVSECLGQAFCVLHALPQTQLCPCPARKGEAAPGYARNAAGSRQQEERAACCPESGQRACCQGEEGLSLLSFLFSRSPSSWAAQGPGGTEHPSGAASTYQQVFRIHFSPGEARARGGSCWVPVAPPTAMSSSLKKCPPRPQSICSRTAV